MSIDKLPLVTLVAPFYNEGGGVEIFFGVVFEIIETIEHCRFEVVCVDDGSTDDTLNRLMTAAAKDSRVKVIEFSRNFGKEAALTAGIDLARGDAVIPLDSDLQDPPELISLLIDRWRGGADVVLARRVDRSSDSLLKRKTAGLFYRVHNRLSPVQIPDNVGDFRLMNRMSVDALKALPERQRFMKGLFAWVGFRTDVVDYVRPPRTEGVSKFSGWKLWNFALEGITSFSTAPLRVWTYLGGVGALCALVYLASVVILTLVHGVDVPGYASILVAILFFGSLQLISVGVLGEYIGRIYNESKGRPIYIVRRIHGAGNEP